METWYFSAVLKGTKLNLRGQGRLEQRVSLVPNALDTPYNGFDRQTVWNDILKIIVMVPSR